MAAKPFHWMTVLVGGCAVALALVSTDGLAQIPPYPPYCALKPDPSDPTKTFWRCRIKMTVTLGQLVIEAEPFLVPNPPPSIPIKAVWKLTQNKYHFEQSDGILMRNTNGQFADPCATDDEEGECTTAAKLRKFRWRISNAAAFSEPYCIVFHDNQGNKLTFDPTIVNSFTFINKHYAQIKLAPVANCDASLAR